MFQQSKVVIASFVLALFTGHVKAESVLTIDLAGWESYGGWSPAQADRVGNEIRFNVGLGETVTRIRWTDFSVVAEGGAVVSDLILSTNGTNAGNDEWWDYRVDAGTSAVSGGQTFYSGDSDAVPAPTILISSDGGPFSLDVGPELVFLIYANSDANAGAAGWIDGDLDGVNDNAAGPFSGRDFLITSGTVQITTTATAIPEPASLLALGCFSIGGIVWTHRRRGGFSKPVEPIVS